MAEALTLRFAPQRAVGGEGVARGGHGQLGFDHVRAGCAEHLAEVRLRPDRTEQARARADHCHWLAHERAEVQRAQQPVDSVLQLLAWLGFESKISPPVMSWVGSPPGGRAQAGWHLAGGALVLVAALAAERVTRASPCEAY